MFRIGQKVVCIHQEFVAVNTSQKAPHPKVGDIVTCDGQSPDMFGEKFMFLAEYPRRYGFNIRNFRPLVEDGFAEELLANITEQVKKEELTLSE